MDYGGHSAFIHHYAFVLTTYTGPALESPSPCIRFSFDTTVERDCKHRLYNSLYHNLERAMHRAVRPGKLCMGESSIFTKALLTVQRLRSHIKSWCMYGENICCVSRMSQDERIRTESTSLGSCTKCENTKLVVRAVGV